MSEENDYDDEKDENNQENKDQDINVVKTDEILTDEKLLLLLKNRKEGRRNKKLKRKEPINRKGPHKKKTKREVIDKMKESEDETNLSENEEIIEEKEW
jgi:hypothetical protein